MFTGCLTCPVNRMVLQYFYSNSTDIGVIHSLGLLMSFTPPLLDIARAAHNSWSRQDPRDHVLHVRTDFNQVVVTHHCGSVQGTEFIMRTGAVRTHTRAVALHRTVPHDGARTRPSTTKSMLKFTRAMLRCSDAYSATARRCRLHLHRPALGRTTSA